jgi:hypothetical protein
MAKVVSSNAEQFGTTSDSHAPLTHPLSGHVFHCSDTSTILLLTAHLMAFFCIANSS